MTQPGHREPYLDTILARLNADLRSDQAVGLAYRVQLLPLWLRPNARGFVLTRTDDDVVLRGTTEADPAAESQEHAELMLASAAGVIQEGVLDEIDRAWPKCPNHQHPLVPDVVGGIAGWRCPSVGSDRWRIGDLPKTPVNSDHSLEESVLDDKEWEEGVRFWREQADRIAESLGQAGEWQSWEPRAFGNGSPMPREDLALCDGRSERLDRAFHISQQPPLENGPLARGVGERLRERRALG